MASQTSQIGGPSRLLAVPLEVLLQITSWLTTPEYGNMRLVCRDLDASLLKPFSHEYFTKMAFMLTESSLGALVDISTSRFAPSLKYLTINLDHPAPIPFTISSTSEATDTARKEFYSHRFLISSGRDVELLTQALRNLPKLETLSLRDFLSYGRYRDGGDLHWRPYGMQTSNQRGVSLARPSFKTWHEPPSGDAEYVCHAFLTLLRALGSANMAQNPPRFEVILRQCHVPELAFYIPNYLQPTILPVLENLEVLFLDLGRTTFPPHLINTATNEEVYGLVLTTFFSKLRSLKHLRLNFSNCEDNKLTPFLRWLAQSSSTSLNASPPTGPSVGAGSGNISQLPQAPSFPRLEQLDIGSLTTEPYLLLNLFKKFRSSLRNISMHKVYLQSNSPDHSTRTNLWARFLYQTVKLGINLSAVDLSNIKQIHNGNSYSIEFKGNKSTSPARKVYEKKWSGSDWERGSRDLIESISVEWRDDESQDEDAMTDFYFSDQYEMDEDEDLDDDLDDDDDDDGL